MPARSSAFFESWSLPLIVTHENKYTVGVFMYSFAASFYLIANHFHIFPPRYLPMSWIDLATPFVANSVWIYSSEYLFFAAIYITCKDMVNLNRYFYSFVTLQIASVAIFWFWPTTYPREHFPLPEDLDRITYWLFSSLRVTDTPASCCPSLHVSSVYLSSFIYLDEQKRKFPFFFLWATAIAVSTLTTKQHYLVDVAMGFICAVASYWIFHRLISYRQAKR